LIDAKLDNPIWVKKTLFYCFWKDVLTQALGSLFEAFIYVWKKRGNLVGPFTLSNSQKTMFSNVLMNVIL
jgi:hypothetical protein